MMKDEGMKGEKDWVDAKTAASMLEIKRQTLYAYVSRGLVRSRGNPNKRGREYSLSDLKRIKVRSDARSGHHAVAASALRWGQPVLDSAITEITSSGPSYRGVLSAALAQEPFEHTVQILWQADLIAQNADKLLAALYPLCDLVSERMPPLMVLPLAMSLLRQSDDDRMLRGEHEVAQASRILRAIPIALASRYGKEAMKESAAMSCSVVANSIARSLASCFRVKGTKRNLHAINTALVLIADHELNPSSFSSRITASVDGDLYACVISALSTLSGPRHGGVGAAIVDVIDDIGDSSHVAAYVKRELSSATKIPGFSHPLYPDGDPRALPMFESVSGFRSKRLNTLTALCETMDLAVAAKPTVDMGLVAVSLALKLGRDGASGIFAAGRCVGWIAHAMEQRRSDFSLRPRARFIGKPVATP